MLLSIIVCQSKNKTIPNHKKKQFTPIKYNLIVMQNMGDKKILSNIYKAVLLIELWTKSTYLFQEQNDTFLNS